MISEIKNYIKLMLGAPVITVELDDSQIELAITNSTITVNNYQAKSQKNVSQDKVTELIKWGALANAMICLGHIRARNSEPWDEGVAFDPEIMITKGWECKDQWINEMKYTFYFDSDNLLSILCSLLSRPDLPPDECPEIALRIMKEINK